MASFLLSSPFTRSFPHFSFLDNLHCSSKRISWHQTSLLELHRLFMEWSDGFLPLPLAFSHTHKHTLAYWTIELGPNPAEILITSLPSPRRAKTTRINMWPVFFILQRPGSLHNRGVQITEIPCHLLTDGTSRLANQSLTKSALRQWGQTSVSCSVCILLKYKLA